MKKLICLLIAVSMVLLIVGCSSESDKDKGDSKKAEEPTEESVKITEIVSESGTVFAPDLTTSGKLSKKISVSDDKIVLCGKKYTLPIRISELIDDGWDINTDSLDRKIKPKTTASLSGFRMINEDGAQFSLYSAYNDTDTEQGLEDCLLTSVYADNLSSESTKAEFIFPGGVVKESTAGDIVSVYGDPNNTDLFSERGYNLEKQLTYDTQKDSGMSFSFVFEEDGTLTYARASAKITKE